MIKFYNHKKKGIFKSPGEATWGNEGWEYPLKEETIIGETNDEFVTRILETSIPYWDENGKYDAQICQIIGINKSWFVSWTSNQLELF